MQVKCVRAFGYFKPGEVVEVPDGALFDEQHWEPATAPVPLSGFPAPAAVTPKEGM